MKVLKSPARGLDVPATSRGENGRTWPGQSRLLGPAVIVTNGEECCAAAVGFQGTRSDWAW